MRLSVLTITLVLLLSACGTYQVKPEKRELAQATVPTCNGDTDCKLKWTAARKWVLDNAAYKLRVVSDDYLETFGPTGGSSLIGMRVSKELQKDGSYRLVVGVWCDNMFGCNPDPWDTAIRFNSDIAKSGM